MRVDFHALGRSLLIAVAAAAFGGCASVPFKVSAMRFDPEPPRQRTFQLAAPRISGVEGSVDAVKLAECVRTALVTQGFNAAPPDQPPEMVIDVFFEQLPTRVEPRTGTEKIYQWQPERTVLTTRQTKTATGLVVTEAVPKRVAARSEAVGSRTVTYVVKVFPKRLRIVGRAQQSSSPPEAGRPLWSVEVRHDNQIHDLDRLALQMIAAAMDHLGDDFSGEKIVSIGPGDKRTKIISQPHASSAQSAVPY